VRGRGPTLLLLVLAFLPPLLRGAEAPARFEPLPADTPPSAEASLYREGFVHVIPHTTFVHSPALAELPDGRLLAVWYGGSWEAAPDAALFMSIWTGGAGWAGGGPTWSPVRRIVTAEETRGELHRWLYTVGNPALLADRRGGVRLFYVTTVLGWSTSAINVKTSADGGASWTPARRLVTSPLANLSTLVKGTPLAYADGSIALPAYHELAGTFPELYRIGRDGAVLAKTRIDHGRRALQPSIVPLGETEAVAFLRNVGPPRRILESRTTDAGAHWTPPRPSALPNPNAAVMGLRLRGGALLLAFNDSPTRREDLSLALSGDRGATWRVFHVFEQGQLTSMGKKRRFAYPSLLQSADGRVHLVYPWGGAHIKHVVFNEAWIRERLAAAPAPR
jgi:predicted neuraminidase